MTKCRYKRIFELFLLLLKKNLFIWFLQVLVVAHGIFDLRCGIQNLWLQDAGSSSLTKDQTQASCTRIIVSATGPQGNPYFCFLKMDTSFLFLILCH